MALVRKAQQGDGDAFTKLYNSYFSVLTAIARSRVGHATAEDMVQESFSIAFRHLRELRDPTSFGPWLIKIMRNCCRKWRRRHPSDTVPIDTDAVDFLVDYSVQRTSLTAIETADLRIDLAAKLSVLPEKYALPLRLHYFEQLTATEIAVLLGLPVTTAKWRIHRSLEICRLKAIRFEVSRQIEVTQGGVSCD